MKRKKNKPIKKTFKDEMRTAIRKMQTGEVTEDTIWEILRVGSRMWRQGNPEAMPPWMIGDIIESEFLDTRGCA